MLTNVFKFLVTITVGMVSLPLFGAEAAVTASAAVAWTMVYWSPELHRTQRLVPARVQAVQKSHQPRR